MIEQSGALPTTTPHLLFDPKWMICRIVALSREPIFGSHVYIAV
jgi:hypothetical protein